MYMLSSQASWYHCITESVYCCTRTYGIIVCFFTVLLISLGLWTAQRTVKPSVIMGLKRSNLSNEPLDVYDGTIEGTLNSSDFAKATAVAQTDWAHGARSFLHQVRACVRVYVYHTYHAIRVRTEYQ